MRHRVGSADAKDLALKRIGAIPAQVGGGWLRWGGIFRSITDPAGLPPSAGIRAAAWHPVGAHIAHPECVIVRKSTTETLTLWRRLRGRWETHGDRAVQIRRGVEKRGQVRVQYGDAASAELNLPK